jgi:hypothetical protein
MSRNGEADPTPAGGWLDGDQQRAWLAYIRVQLRLAYEMNRQLLADSGMSLPDYDVLTALSVADGGRMPITVLAAQIGWERSRVSHHVRRMSDRGGPHERALLTAPSRSQSISCMQLHTACCALGCPSLGWTSAVRPLLLRLRMR